MDTTIDAVRAYVRGDDFRAIIVAVVIIAITALVAHLLTRLIRRVLQTDGVPLPSSTILVNIGRVAVWMLGISVTLSSCFNIDVNALIAALGVGGIAISLGLQDTIKNFIGGLQVTLMRIVEPGDHIIVNNIDGIVQDVNWRQTVVKDYENGITIVPNSVISTTAVQQVKPEATVGTVVVLNTDGRDLDFVLGQMEQAAKKALAGYPLVKDPWILLTQIKEDGIYAKLRFVLENADHAREARDAALRAIAPYTRTSAGDLPSEAVGAAPVNSPDATPAP